MVHQHECKQPHQVLDRKYKRLDRLLLKLVIEHAHGVVEKHDAKQHSSDEINNSAHADEPGKNTDYQQ